MAPEAFEGPGVTEKVGWVGGRATARALPAPRFLPAPGAAHVSRTPSPHPPTLHASRLLRGPQADVFSFAVLCWEMLTARVPWRELAGPMQARARGQGRLARWGMLPRGVLSAPAPEHRLNAFLLHLPHQAPLQIIYQVGVLHARLPIPASCPPFLRQLIQESWAVEPGDRPSFAAIRQRLVAELARVQAQPEAQQEQCSSSGGGVGDGSCSSADSEADVASAAGSQAGLTGDASSGGAADGGNAWITRGGGVAAPEPPPAADAQVLPFGSSAAAAVTAAAAVAPAAAAGEAASLPEVLLLASR